MIFRSARDAEGDRVSKSSKQTNELDAWNLVSTGREAGEGWDQGAMSISTRMVAMNHFQLELYTCA